MQKSKILALLLVVAMMASFVVVPANADPYVPTACHYCGAVDEWTEWDGVSALTEGGHYYLTSDLEVDYRTPVGVNCCFDLCGNTIYGPEGTGNNSGQLFRIYNGADVNVMSSKTGGTIEGRGLYSKTDNGGLIYISGDGTNVNFYNVTITNGRAGSGHGGNVYITKAAATFENCVISDGSASKRGGNIYVEGASADRGELTIINCTITGGAASGWSETKGVCGNGYADMRLTNVTSEFVTVAANTTLNVYGGTYGYLYAAAAATTHIYGGAISNLAGKEVVNVHNAYVATTNFTADTNGAIAAGADTLVLDEAEGGKFYYHAAGTCATCGVTYTGDLDLLGKTVTVPEGKTLDTTVAGNIIDSVGGGSITGSVLFSDENEMLPIEVANGVYAFEDLTVKQGFVDAFDESAEMVRYAFYIDKASDKTYIDEALAAGTLKLQILVEYTNAEGAQSKLFVLEGDMLNSYVQAENWDTKMLAVKLTGLEGITKLDCTASVVVNEVVAG